MEVSITGVPQYYCNLSQLRNKRLPRPSKKDLQEQQKRDPLCSLAREALKNKLADMLLVHDLKDAKIVYKE